MLSVGYNIMCGARAFRHDTALTNNTEHIQQTRTHEHISNGMELARSQLDLGDLNRRSTNRLGLSIDTCLNPTHHQSPSMMQTRSSQAVRSQSIYMSKEGISCFIITYTYLYIYDAKANAVNYNLTNSNSSRG